MGILDIFKPKNKETKESVGQAPQAQSIQNNASSNASISRDNHGNIIVEYYDPVATAREFYDTTKLVINPIPTRVEGQLVYSAKVAWYGSSDCIVMDPTTGEIIGGRKGAFTDIKLEIDNERLFTDPMYQKVLMTQLLDQKRVEYRYIPMGLEEYPEQPCGNYVGRVSREYKKQFDVAVGQAIHNSPEMIEKRQRHFERIEKARQAQIAEKRAQIEKLQQEMDELNK